MQADTLQIREQARPVRIAAFDYDGTSIEGNSPVLLVYHLMKHKMLDKSVIARIALWGVAYKFRLPQNEAWVRGLVFRAFAGMSKEQVDRFLRDFHDERLAKLFRPKAEEVMQAHREAGDVVVLVSATFEPIVERAMEFHPIDHQISTRMRVADDGTYSCEVDGIPVEGDQKIVELTRFANERYGEGNWVIVDAYGDHHSDRTMLAEAQHPHAICPDRPLGRTARRLGWDIQEWGL